MVTKINYFEWCKVFLGFIGNSEVRKEYKKQAFVEHTLDKRLFSVFQIEDTVSEDIKPFHTSRVVKQSIFVKNNSYRESHSHSHGEYSQNHVLCRIIHVFFVQFL